MTNQESRKALSRRNNSLLAVTAIKLAQAESSALRQVNDSISKIRKEEKYGHALREKPDHSIRIVMENFNSLCVTSGNSKINTINNLCRDFKVDILCGCKT
jgi:flagellar basal body rod protein FlgF